MTVFVGDWLPLLLLLAGGLAAVWIARGSYAGPTRTWRRAALAMRLAVLTLLAAALMDMQARRESDTRAVVVCLDRSKSIPAALRDRAEAWVRRVGSEMAERDRLGVILFGDGPGLEFLPMAAPPVTPFTAAVDVNGSDLASALRLAQASFPEGAARRVLLVSDGNQTRGDVLDAATKAGAAGVRVDVLPMRYVHEAEVSVERVTAPTRADAEQGVEVRVTVASSVETPATLTLHEDGALVATEEITLKPGKNSFVVTRQLGSGFHRFEATVNAKVDTLPANNRGFAFTQVEGQPRVLLVESNPEHADALARAVDPKSAGLDLEGIGLEVVSPSGLPTSIAELQNYDCVILSNVPASACTLEQMKLLQGAVRDLGMGLIMIGGEESFAAGGWLGTPVEETLPVDMEIRQKRVLPNGALVLIMHTCEFADGNNWGRQITKQAIKVLSEHDLVGVCYFGFGGVNGYAWCFDLQAVGKRGKGWLLAQVDKMEPSDMPDYDTTLQMAHDALVAPTTDAAMRHVVIVSDGDAAPPSPALVASCQKSKISVTGIEIFPHGDSGPNGTLARLAKATQGSYHSLAKPGDEKRLPSILIKEALTVRRSLVSEQTFRPTQGHVSEVMAGLDVPTLPALHGYVIASPKDEAAVPLRGPETDPILAHWQYGLGRALAFTSDAKPRWARDWVAWTGFPKFWSQAVRWTARSLPKSPYRLTVEPQGSEARVVLDAVNAQGAFVNDLEVMARGTAPDASSVALPLRQTGPGRYEATLPLSQVGVYMLNAAFRGPKGEQGAIFSGLAVNYSPEFASRTDNAALLRQVAEKTGGRVFSPLRMDGPDGRPMDPPEALFTDEALMFGAPWPLWPVYLTLAVALFLLDVAFRRVQVDWRPVRRAIRTVVARVPVVRRLTRPAVAPAAVLTGSTGPATPGLVPPVPVPGGAGIPLPAYLAGGPAGAATATAPASATAPAAGAAPAPAAGGAADAPVYTRRLLEAKKRALGKGGRGGAGGGGGPA